MNHTKKKRSLRDVLREVHADQQGVVSLETILIIGAISLPILIFLIKVGWPTVKNYFISGLDELQQGASDAAR
jgi:hypothetical protein